MPFICFPFKSFLIYCLHADTHCVEGFEAVNLQTVNSTKTKKNCKVYKMPTKVF